jgi:hypothetical protein
VTNILPTSTALSVENTATLDLNGASQIVASLAIAPGASVHLNGGHLTVTGNGGSAVVQGSLTGSGSLTNTGTLRLTGDAVLDFTGPFTNTGILDIMTWSGPLPAGFVNNGIVLDHSAVKIASFARSGNDFTLTILGYTGHNYQLQRCDSLSDAWQDVGPALPGNNAPLVFTDSGGASPARRFYRVSLHP